MYEIRSSDRALKQLKKLPKDVHKRIIKVLDRIKVRPFSYLETVVGSSYYKLRIGDYRVIVRVDKNEIFVVEVKHRNQIYKKLS